MANISAHMSNKSKPVLFYLTAFMSSLYPILGFYVLLAPDVEYLLPGYKRYVLGILLIGYGGFRMYRIKQLHKQMQQQD
ncbi:MAG TPA: hypothetical protein PLD36_05520 [Bacteroidia bacterium]|nr:hypothetical protein [Bacteroidia bacterium]